MINTKITTIRLYQNDINKIKQKIKNISKFFRYIENKYYYYLIKNKTDELLITYKNYLQNYDIKKTKLLSYNHIENNKIYTRKYLASYIHYNLTELLKNYKEI